jgi:hypothetical protein
VGKPAAPTTDPIGSAAADDSVAGAAVDVVVVAAGVDEAVEVLEAVELAVDAVAPACVGDVALGAGVEPAELLLSLLPPGFNVIALNLVLDSLVSELSCTRSDAVSDCAGTALPSTTMRP